ncbi:MULTISPECIES: carbohydrate ABC transporter permease [unclassified Microbacterium]|jgi:multiple sugar transport system permease protein|uniref:carbohydrate ABC transporter permease n=1 Tax=unclassified Microbacterium TaxID=2609290 RepID=UPI0006F9A100|nr:MULTISPECIES: carbohydrate ABC transporter permease [unclassified Microbacterium]AOX46311.1 sugar ABC transporter ATP-binding protein [Microbacterium sp. BH-3-3-3]KQR84750.1 sugar ABC transporter ATP-binding protein [Microbacterium sp. Leaf179]KQT75632.1 sugar ABC transporter ATP-binding protein [Microbacterium sp. Leaf436]MBD8205931.1 carbohydrate ABC transporter permease [Microbacterium sp. CFBP 8801]MBD8217830.1 carbohydrate ABC transporter permease [Microbacterium sp. CFBP 13617]
MTDLLVPDATRTLVTAGAKPPRRRPVAGSARPVRRVGRIVGYAVMILAAAALLMPFFWMIMSSLKTPNDVFSAPVKWFPETWVWSNYIDIWTQSGMLTWIRNTLVLAVVVTFLQVLTGSFAAYGFSRMRFPGRDVLFLVYIGTIAVPWQSYMIPQFILLSNAKVSNTLWAIILIQAFGAFGVFLMKQYYDTIPEDLSEAARLDGLSEYGIWARIMVPLSVPAIASLTMLTFVGTWNDYLGPLIYLRSPDLWTIQLGLQSFVSTLYDANYALLFAGLTMSVVPIAIVFLFGQKYFVEGIATSGMKG